MIRVILEGALEKFGGPFDLHATSPARAFRLLDAQIAGLGKTVAEHQCIAVVVDGVPIKREFLDFQRDAIEVRFIPIPHGADFGIGEIAGLAAGAAASAAAGAGATVTAAYAISAIAYGITYAALYGALSYGLTAGLSMLQASGSAAPKRDANSDTKKQSYSFDGPVNVSAEGVAVPILNGKLRIGGIIISYREWSRDIAPGEWTP